MTVICGFDLGFKNDASAAAIVHKRDGRYTLVGHLEQRPSKGAPLVPGNVLASIAALCKRHRCQIAYGDNHYAETAREVLGKEGIGFTLAPAGNSGKLQVYERAKELILEGRVSVPGNLPALVAQLKAVRTKPLSGGNVSLESPRTRAGHGDSASAFVLALWAASESYELPAGPIYNRVPDLRHESPSDNRWCWNSEDWDDDE
jgi:hypothetical protein